MCNPGGSLALLGSGIMCGAGLKLSLHSLQQIISTTKDEKQSPDMAEKPDKDQKECEESNWLQLMSDTSLGALNGLISSIGLVCIEQNQCHESHRIESLDATQQLIITYAAVGLVTGTINGTINQVINMKENRNMMHHKADEDIELFNVGKTGFMEMGSNMITAIGKATLFKSATDKRRCPRSLDQWNMAHIYHPPACYVSYMRFNQAKRRLYGRCHDAFSKQTTSDVIQSRSFLKILTVSPYRKQTRKLQHF